MNVGSSGIVYTIYAAKTLGLISCTVTTQLVCTFVFACAKQVFSGRCSNKKESLPREVSNFAKGRQLDLIAFLCKVGYFPQ